MNKQEAQQKFSEELIAELKKTIVPDDQIPFHYSEVKEKVLAVCSLAWLQSQFPITTQEYIDLTEKAYGFTLFEVQTINALVMMRTPADFGGLREYTSAVNDAVTAGSVYGAMVQPISESIKTRIELTCDVKGLWGKPLKMVN